MIDKVVIGNPQFPCSGNRLDHTHHWEFHHVGVTGAVFEKCIFCGYHRAMNVSMAMLTSDGAIEDFGSKLEIISSPDKEDA